MWSLIYPKMVLTLLGMGQDLLEKHDKVGYHAIVG